MSVTFQEIQAPIADEMNAFERQFRVFMKSQVPMLNSILSYLVKRKGKQIRPMFVLLCAGALGKITEASYRGAILIELLHTASLVHDDVVDDSNYRRGFFSVNALWKSKIAVLAGDFLISRALLISIDHGDFDILRIVGSASRELTEGELLQMEKARRLDITEQVYFDIIRQKTATLIASCCAVGASSADADLETISRARLFGEKLGIAFQIKDDLMDYGSDEIGKPLGIDIKEKKLTLPLIYALSQADWLKKRHIIHLIKRKSHQPSKVQEVIAFVKESGGIAYATEVMKQYEAEAHRLLQSFPESAYRDALGQLVRFTIERSK